MNCPKCSLPITSDQQFCRGCGNSLADDPARRFDPRAWGFAVLMLMFGGMLVSMTGKMLELRWMTFTGVFIMIGGMFALAAYSLMRQLRPKRPKASPNTRPDSLSAVHTTNKLPPIPAIDHFPSVTEGTTNLLAVPAEQSNSGRLKK